MFQIEGDEKTVYRRIAALLAAIIITGIQALPMAAEGLSKEIGGKALSTSAAKDLELSAEAFEMSIRFFDKRVYYPESQIPIKITITNRSSATIRFKLAEDRVYSLAFEARSPVNRSLEAADDYKKALATTKPVFYREMALEPGEEYSFVEDFSRYIKVDGAGSYTIRAIFYPELAQAASSAAAANILSNTLILSVRPSIGLPPASDVINADTGEIIRPLPIPPDEVVRKTIEARQKTRWNDFFLYLDIEALMSRNESKKRAYDRESDDGRRRMLEQYKADLRQNVVDQDVVTIPSSFEIIETRYTANAGIVRVIEKFDYKGFKMVKEYDYQLIRKDDIWFIEGYTVFNKGTE